MELKNCDLSILLCDDQEIRELNQQYRNIDKATDVLSFSLQEGEGAEFSSDSLGDVVISLETAQYQAEDFAVSLRDEIFRLLIHGVLHLAGYEHEGVDRSKIEEMERKEEELFEKLTGQKLV